MPYWEINCGTGRRQCHGPDRYEAVKAVIGDHTMVDDMAICMGNPGHIHRYRIKQISAEEARHIREVG